MPGVPHEHPHCAHHPGIVSPKADPPNSPLGAWQGKQNALPMLPNRKWQGTPASPLSDTLSAPNPNMRRQLGAGIPFWRQQMGRGDAPWGWGAAAEGPARSGSAS